MKPSSQKRELSRAHITCWYCGYRTWLVYSRPVADAWRQKPPWIRLGPCCKGAMVYMTPRTWAPLGDYFDDDCLAPLDSLSPSQLHRRVNSRQFPGAPRDPTRKYHAQQERVRESHAREERARQERARQERAQQERASEKRALHEAVQEEAALENRALQEAVRLARAQGQKP